jgi:ribose 5-phosphate isomerase A
MSEESAGPEASAARALEFVSDGQTLGLGTGRAAAAFVRALGARVADGLRVRGVPTSDATDALARSCGIPLLSLEQAGQLDTTFDGADEVDPQLDVIKGYGGALVREKIVAACSAQIVILVGVEKLVDRLGARGKLPVEVVPFGVGLAQRTLQQMGFESALRLASADSPLKTDNGNYILDCKVGPLDDPAGLDREIQAIPGVVGTGLFVGMANAVVIQHGNHVEVRHRAS